MDEAGLGDRFEEILDSARAGSEAALAEIYRAFFPALLGYLKFQDPAEGEDLASEVFIEGAAGLDRFKGDESAFKGWIFTIARRRLIDFRRKVKRRKTDPVPSEDLSDIATERDPEHEALEQTGSDEAMSRIRKLPKDQADVILLRVIGGFDVSEVARILGKRPGTIRVLQHRGLKRLAENFDSGE
jgi:RNA polymerase sigma-70 factor (ECF subfamily)